MMMKPFLFHHIGIMHTTQRYRYETPRQGVFARDRTGIIELLSSRNFEQALTELEGFSRIWVLYAFHLNPNWKPMVNVPRHRRKKVGVFATRAPYRPNPIGMSCLTLLSIDGLKLHVGEVDLLDGTPILDIKPYLPYADSFSDAATGWVIHEDLSAYRIQFTAHAEAQVQWFRTNAGINLQGFIEVQLQHDPTNTKRKRIRQSADSDANYTLAYRTWRIDYHVEEEQAVIEVFAIRSGYTEEDLQDDADEHRDKRVHEEFLARFIGK